MASAAHVNHYRRRLVAQDNEKSCTVCYRPTNVVLMSVDSRDWFYCCATHLKDPGFAVPCIDQAAERERLKKIEIAKVTAEYEEKKARKAASKEDEEGEAAKKKKPGTIGSWIPNPFAGKSSSESASTAAAAVEPESATTGAASEVKEFTLHRTMYQHRCSLKHQAAQQKARDAQWATLQFPSVPK